jgi:hypothetical protein
MSILAESVNALCLGEGPHSALQSVFHIQSYLMGVSLGTRWLGNTEVDEGLSYNRFRNFVRNQNDLEQVNEFVTCAFKARTWGDSAQVYLQMWRTFQIPQSERVVLPQIDRTIDLSSSLEDIRTRPHFYMATADVSHLVAMFAGTHFVATRCGNGKMVPDTSALANNLQERAGRSVVPLEILLTARCGGDAVAAFYMYFDEARRTHSETQLPNSEQTGPAGRGVDPQQ